MSIILTVIGVILFLNLLSGVFFGLADMADKKANKKK